MTDCAIVWFRRDLRLADNPALQYALDAHCDAIVPLFIQQAPDELGGWAPGGAQRVWQHFSLVALDESLQALGSRLIIRRGPTLATLDALIEECGVTAIFWNRLYDPATIARDRAVKTHLQGNGIQVRSFQAHLLHEPWTIASSQNKPYKVFTPFWKAARDRPIAAPLAALRALPTVSRDIASETVAALGLLPGIAWDRGIRDTWNPGENGAHAQLERFLCNGLAYYANARELPAVVGTSRLSPHLHWGEIGPRQIVHRLEEWQATRQERAAEQHMDTFLREIGWREFAHHVLYHFPETPEKPLDTRFEAFPWVDDKPALQCWQRGQTGIPMVDAGMRELWATGYMHNRLRMTVASFLSKNLRIAWQHGARWFWDTLVDADLANNTLGWQWAAGCGADAAPFFRIFNPARQSERFDPDGDYIRRWVPELARLGLQHIHRPWDAPPSALADAGVVLGDSYPRPIVDLKISRRKALDAFGQIRN